MHEPESEAGVRQHYHRDGLTERLPAALTAAGLDSAPLSPEVLAPLDQFHTGGRPATLELLRLSGFTGGMTVLDAGGGLGGAARTLAADAGCRVKVLDLSPAYCEAGQALTARCGLHERVAFECGSALATPYADGSFDGVWTQHSTMNIADKAALYRECYRVLRPGGRLAMHEIMAGPAGGDLPFPLPWASEPEHSALTPPEQARELLRSSGFRELHWQDRTEPSRAVVRALAERLAGPLPALGLHLLMDDFPQRAENYRRAIEAGQVAVVMAVWERPA